MTDPAHTKAHCLGYFLLFECMLESIIYARKTYLDQENGLGK